MKTVCFVVRSFPVVSQTFVVNQIIAAKKQGFKVKILTKNLNDNSNSSQEKLIIQHDLRADVLIENYAIPRSKITRFTLALWLIISNFNSWLILKKDLDNYKDRLLKLPFKIAFYKALKKIDVFHIQFAVAGLDLAKMKALGLLHGKLVTTFHGYDAHYSTEGELSNLKKRYAYLIAQSETITVNTPFLERQVVKLGAVVHKMHIIPMGIEVDYFKPVKKNTLPKNKQVELLSIGRLIEFKGFYYAIQAVKHLVNQGYNVKYTIVGEGQLQEELDNLIISLQLENHVVLAGKKSQTAIKKILHESHIFLMSSIIDRTGRGETQGVVTAEAQAAGLPVVAFNCGGIPYTIEQGVTGILVPEKQAFEYAEAITSIIDSPKKHEMMSQAAVAFVADNFTNVLMGKRFAELYD
mgnify:CR=1 FL=1